MGIIFLALVFGGIAVVVIGAIIVGLAFARRPKRDSDDGDEGW
jgi:hypothetical protein